MRERGRERWGEAGRRQEGGKEGRRERGKERQTDRQKERARAREREREREKFVHSPLSLHTRRGGSAVYEPPLSAAGTDSQKCSLQHLSISTVPGH